MNSSAPSSGLKPPALEGREAEIEAFDSLIVRTKRQAERGMLLSGLRRVGKTVLLNNFAAQAECHDWFVVLHQPPIRGVVSFVGTRPGSKGWGTAWRGQR